MNITDTALTRLLGIKYPIIQGGMAWVSNASLAAGVSNAGGLGLIASGSADADIIRREISRARELTDKPFGVNIMLMNPHSDDIAQMIAEEKIAAVTTGAGSPGKYIEGWKAAGIKVLPVIPAVALAQRMEKLGADAVIAEGCEAGGHIGEMNTMALVPQVVDAVKIPVVAAGGIADGRGMAAAFMLGASGVQCGTVFLTADECTIHDTYKAMVIEAKDSSSAVTGRSTGLPCRQIKNKMTRKYLEMEKQGVTAEELEELTLGSLRRAVLEGDRDGGSFMAGQVAGMVTGRASCESIINSMIEKASRLLGG